MKKADFFKILSLFFILLFAGCGGGGSSAGSTKVTDYSFSYNSDMTGINGYFTISLDDVLPQNTLYSREVTFTNFRVDAGSCGITTQNFDPSEFTLSDNGSTNQKVDVDFTFNSVCNEDSFTIKADKIITITYPGSSRSPQISNDDFSRTFSVSDNYSHSGKINNISLVYKETKPYSETSPYFTDTFVIHAVDKYGKAADIGEKVHVGTIIGVAKSANEDYLFSENGGAISYNDNNVSFKADKNISNISTSGSNKNILIILPNDQKYSSSYLGGWDIDEKIDDYNLSLNTQGYDINFTAENGLKYVIGSQSREPICGNSPVANIDSSDGIYVINEDGKAYVKLTYDPSLLGKTVYLYANSAPGNNTNKNRRVGIGASFVLIGNGIKIDPDTISNDNNQSDTKTITITIAEIESNDDFQNTEFNLTAFTPDYEKCKVTPNIITTNCDGEADINVTVPANSSCTLNAKVVREH